MNASAAVLASSSVFARMWISDVIVTHRISYINLPLGSPRLFRGWLDESRPHHRAARCTEQAHAIVEDDPDRYGLKQRSHAALCHKGLDEMWSLEFFQDLWRDPTAQVDAA